MEKKTSDVSSVEFVKADLEANFAMKWLPLGLGFKGCGLNYGQTSRLRFNWAKLMIKYSSNEVEYFEGETKNLILAAIRTLVKRSSNWAI